MNLKSEIKIIGTNLVAQAMKLNPEKECHFLAETTVDADGEAKRLLIGVKTFGKFGDGRYTAILNPSSKLKQRLIDGWYFETSNVAGHCDLMCSEWVLTNGSEPKAICGTSYRARKPQPARS